jgi:hypothetical protein
MFGKLLIILSTIFLLWNGCTCAGEADSCTTSKSVVAVIASDQSTADVCSDCGHKKACCSRTHSQGLPVYSSEAGEDSEDNLLATACDGFATTLQPNFDLSACIEAKTKFGLGSGKIYLLKRCLLI